jgi:hypothetical protein
MFTSLYYLLNIFIYVYGKSMSDTKKKSNSVEVTLLEQFDAGEGYEIPIDHEVGEVDFEVAREHLRDNEPYTTTNKIITSNQSHISELIKKPSPKYKEWQIIRKGKWYCWKVKWWTIIKVLMCKICKQHPCIWCNTKKKSPPVSPVPPPQPSIKEIETNSFRYNKD